MFDFPMSVYVGATLVGVALPLFWWSISASRPTESASRRLQSGFSTDLREVVLAQSASERLVSPGVRRLASFVRRHSPGGFVENLERKTALAGASTQWPIDRLLAVKVLLGGAGAVLGVLRYAAAPSLQRLTFAMLLVVAGFWGPDYLLNARARRRQNDISVSLPDVLDQMTISVEAGLGFEPALLQIGEHVKGPIGEEFLRTVQDIRLGMGREKAFRAFGERTDSREIRQFVTSMIQADKLGVPLAQVLRTQASEMRLIRRQRAEEEAQKLPLKMIFPLILCILPSLVMVLLGPAILQAIDGFPGL